MTMIQKKIYERPSAQPFYVEQTLSYLSYFSGVGLVDEWETGDELEFDEIEEP